MRQKKILYNTKLFNSLVSGIIITIFSAALILSLTKEMFQIPLDSLALSVNNIKSFKIWTLLSYHIAGDNQLYAISMLIICTMLIINITKAISFLEVSRYLLYSSLSAAIIHLLTTSPSAQLSGLSSILLALLLLFSLLHGKKPLFRVFKHIITFNHLIFAIIVVNIVTAQSPWRADSVSVTSQLTIIIFAIIFFKRISFKKIRTPENNKACYTRPEPINPMNKSNSIPLEKQVDDILDKINQKGIHALSEKERRILKKASRKSKR